MRNISLTGSDSNERQIFESVLERAIGDEECVQIARHGADDAVVMSLDYYNSLIETIYLLQSPANAAHLSRSIEQFRGDRVTERDLLDE
ncbi:MAG: type II toxin-antitoxin system Phd/YefM family antitoxin [Geitlerinemataceae cyanobacterium]